MTLNETQIKPIINALREVGQDYDMVNLQAEINGYTLDVYARDSDYQTIVNDFYKGDAHYKLTDQQFKEVDGMIQEKFHERIFKEETVEPYERPYHYLENN